MQRLKRRTEDSRARRGKEQPTDIPFSNFRICFAIKYYLRWVSYVSSVLLCEDILLTLPVDGVVLVEFERQTNRRGSLPPCVIEPPSKTVASIELMLAHRTRVHRPYGFHL